MRRFWMVALAIVMAGSFVAGQQGTSTPKLSKGIDGTGEDDDRGPTLYEQWIEKQKAGKAIPIVEAQAADALTQEALPWPEIGAKGAYFRLLKNQMMDAAMIEVTGAAATKQHRHTYEEFLYAVSGSGTTVIQQPGRRTETLQWSKGSFFPIPLNALHEHKAAAGTTARLLSVTGLPLYVNMTGDGESVYTNTRAFTERYDSQEDYFRTSKRIGNMRYATNFIKDIRSFEVDRWDERGKGNRSMFWDMGGNRVLGPHISEFEPATYKNGHRHRHEAVIYILNGTGYSLIWQDFGKPKMKVDWREGSVVLVPPFWFHQHFNTGEQPARYLAITTGAPLSRFGLDTADQIMEDEAEIKTLFEKELAAARAKRKGSQQP